MNPNAGPRGSSEVVLLFESKPGWNQNGGPELLSCNHRQEGCNVLFADMHVEFVKAENFHRLQWRYADAADANVPGGP
jgi:hypothetical protein